MQDPLTYPLPFFTRDMFKFEHGAAFSLEIVAYASLPAVIQIIGMTREGIFKFRFTHTGDNTEDTQSYRLPDIPSFLTVYTDDPAVERGEFWCTVYLRVNGERVQKLCAGYVSKQSGLNYPNTQTESEFSGGGKYNDVGGADPAAGAEASIALNANYRFIVHAATVTLVTDANIINRRVHLKFTYGTGGGVYDFFGSVDQPAGTTRKYTFANFGSGLTESDDDDILVPLPQGLQMYQGGSVTTSTSNLQVGDNFSILFLLLERYFEAQ